MFTSRSFLTFFQTILYALDLPFLLSNGQMRDAQDGSEHRMAPLALLHLFPETSLYIGHLLPHRVWRSLSLSGFFNLQGQRGIVVLPKILPILRSLFDNIPVTAVLVMASFLVQQILEISLRGHTQESFQSQALGIVPGWMEEETDDRFVRRLLARHRLNTRIAALEPGNQRLEERGSKVGRCQRIAVE
jgi:hypothetical protein